MDAYQSAQERRDPRLRDHLGLAERLLAAGRAAAASEVLVATPAGLVRSGRRHAELRITALDALGRRDEAQDERWELFCSALSVDALRGFLKRLPDFEDVDREETALAHAEQHQDLGAALAFLLAWPDHRRVAVLVRRRAAALPGLDDVVLTAVANQLAYRDPLAATLLFRAGIDATLSRGKAGGYGRAAQSLLECEGLSAAVADWEMRPDHQTYLARLRSSHARQVRCVFSLRGRTVQAKGGEVTDWKSTRGGPVSERTPVPADNGFRHALRLICTARQTRVHAETHGPRVRRALEELADRQSLHAMALVTGALR